MDRPEAPLGIVELARRYVALTQGVEPRGLELLRQLREVLADLYAALVKLPGLGIEPAPTTGILAVTPDDAPVQSGLAARIPPGLYWSSLLPLTWETVGDRGVQQLAENLTDIRHRLRTSLESRDGGHHQHSLLALQLEVPDLCRSILEALTILHEVVTDLEAYEKAG